MRYFKPGITNGIAKKLYKKKQKKNKKKHNDVVNEGKGYVG